MQRHCVAAARRLRMSDGTTHLCLVLELAFALHGQSAVQHGGSELEAVMNRLDVGV